MKEKTWWNLPNWGQKAGKCQLCVEPQTVSFWWLFFDHQDIFVSLTKVVEFCLPDRNFLKFSDRMWITHCSCPTADAVLWVMQRSQIITVKFKCCNACMSV